MRTMQDGQGVPRVQDVQPCVHLLRGETYPESRYAEDRGIGMLKAQDRRDARLDEVRPQRAGNPQARGRTFGYWPGMSSGVRAPTKDETALSEEEVDHGLWRGCFAIK